MNDKYFLNTATYGTHNIIARLMGSDKEVLDVGCNRGYLKKLSPDNVFYGLDYSLEDLEVAKKAGYKETYQVDLNRIDGFKIDKSFELIVFGDVLEHLLDPKSILQNFIDNNLVDNGKVIISLPNIANLFIRLNLLFGRFNYQDNGILDKTHLHFYTLKTAREFIDSCGLSIKEEKFSSNIFGGLIKRLPCFGGLLGYNLIFICQK